MLILYFKILMVEKVRNMLFLSILKRVIVIVSMLLQDSKSNTFSRINVGLTTIPNGIPSDITRLDLYRNSITEVDPSKLSQHDSLENIDLHDNLLAEFPDFCHLRILKKLYIGNNPITVINADLINCLDKIILLHIDKIKLNHFPDLTAIGDTLKELSFSSAFAVPISSSDFQPLDKIRYLVLEGAKLVSFPDVKPIGDTLILIQLADNMISSIPQDIAESLTVIENILVNKNSFTTNPDLCCMKDTLIKYVINHNLLTQIKPEFIHCMLKLEILELGGYGIASLNGLNIQTFSGTMKKLYIEGTSISSLPEMRNMPYMEELSLSDNSLLSEFPADSFENWSSLEKLKLNKNSISKLPTFHYFYNTLQQFEMSESQVYQITIGNIGVLRNLKKYILKDTSFGIAFIPPPCSVDHSNLKINVQGVNVDLCACSHVWIKMAEELGADVEIDGTVKCAGTKWSSVSSGYLWDFCDTSLPNIQSVKAKRVMRNYHCAFPYLETHANMTVARCLQICMFTTGCYSFNFKMSALSNGEKIGDCVILAPRKSGMSLLTGNADTGWEFYEVIGKDLI